MQLYSIHKHEQKEEASALWVLQSKLHSGTATNTKLVNTPRHTDIHTHAHTHTYTEVEIEQ